MWEVRLSIYHSDYGVSFWAGIVGTVGRLGGNMYGMIAGRIEPHVLMDHDSVHVL